LSEQALGEASLALAVREQMKEAEAAVPAARRWELGLYGWPLAWPPEQQGRPRTERSSEAVAGVEAGLEAKVKSSAWEELKKGAEEAGLGVPEPRMVAVVEEREVSAQKTPAEEAEEEAEEQAAVVLR